MTRAADETERLAEDVAADRARIDHALAALHRKLAPARAASDALHFLRSDTGKALTGAGRLALSHPVPTALIGAGLFWLLFGPRRKKPRQHLAAPAQPALPPVNTRPSDHT